MHSTTMWQTVNYRFLNNSVFELNVFMKNNNNINNNMVESDILLFSTHSYNHSCYRINTGLSKLYILECFHT